MEKTSKIKSKPSKKTVISEELKTIASNVSRRCGLGYVERSSEAKLKKNALMLGPAKRDKINLYYYDKNQKIDRIKEGAESTIKNVLENIHLGCVLHNDFFSKRCDYLGGNEMVTNLWGYTDYNNPMCRFLDAKAKPEEGKDWFKLTNAEREYNTNIHRIIKMDVVWSSYNKPTNIYAWVIDPNKSARGTWEVIRTDEMTLKEWINKKEWEIKEDRLWSAGLPDEESDKLGENPEDYERIAKRGHLTIRGDSFKTRDSRREDIISFFSEERFRDWQTATPRPPKITKIMDRISKKEKELEKAGNEDLSKFMNTLYWDIGNSVPDSSTNVAYNQDAFKRKFMVKSPFPELHKMAKEIKDLDDKMSWYDRQYKREYFKDDLNWKQLDKAKRTLRRIDKKINADKQFSKEIPKLQKDLTNAAITINLFEDKFDEWGDDEKVSVEFEKWAKQKESEKK